ncbi:sigma 54-interacting transcriptional regulator [Bacillus sp. Marseille-P3661]|uniref:sigma 54-interacting transcriptional regulator n=1 Tax=Bacillus sp. Marseille-P3661 TaxID=1936234 RepID=UPI000C84A8A1|nr:sigma 54-interacting transcriptional regulator [Bacillus sp. Marseille-P3661]
MNLTRLIDSHIPSIQVSETVEKAKNWFDQSSSSWVSVLNNSMYVGMLEEGCFQNSGDSLQDIIRKDVPVLYDNAEIHFTSGVFSPVIPVINKDLIFQGCIRYEVLIEHLLIQGKLYSSIIENSNDGIMVINHEGNIELVNSALIKLSGYPEEAYIGKNITAIIKTGVFKKPSVTLRALKEQKAVADFQQYHKGIDVLVKAIPLFNNSGQLVRVLANVHDITELIDSKKQLEKTQILSQQYQKKISDLEKQVNAAGNVVVSPQMKEIMNIVTRIANTDSTILIYGESGAGKEIISREIHERSNRKDNGPFIKVNCGAIPHELLESEFFGYESGAFTGAIKGGKKGLFENANKGTLFLDEIGELPLNLQAKLLRVLQDKKITRIGGITEIQVDVRIIAATNRDLEKMVLNKEFRDDLYYRINVIPITLPPLRERKEEIIPLIVHFLTKFNQKYSKKMYISASAMEAFRNYSWPGNVRELSNVIERLVVITNSDEILLENLPVNILEENRRSVDAEQSQHKEIPFSLIQNTNGENMFEFMEKKLIIFYLETHGSIRKAARELGVSHTTLMKKMKKHNINLKRNINII